MRTLLRNTVTGLYLESPGAWTSQSDAAFAFDKMGQAIGFARQSELTGMELVFVSDAAGPLLRVPLESIDFACPRPVVCASEALNHPSLAAPV